MADREQKIIEASSLAAKTYIQVQGSRGLSQDNILATKTDGSTQFMLTVERLSCLDGTELSDTEMAQMSIIFNSEFEKALTAQ